MKEQLPLNIKRFTRDTMNLKVDALLIMHKSGQFNYDASYQRGLVWTDHQKEELISSLVEWLPINAIYLNEHSESEAYEVVDGKQRLTTIFDFCNDGFRWKGYLFSELPDVYQNVIKSFPIAAYMTSYKTLEEREKLYNRINYTGTPHQ